MLRSILRATISPRKLNGLHLLYAFSQIKVERFPQFDKIFVFLFYRFAFFRNAFLRRPRAKLPEGKTSSEFAPDFGFSEENLRELEAGGISKVFHLAPAMVGRLRQMLNECPLVVNGKLVPQSVDFLPGRKEFHGDLDGVYYYRGLNSRPEIAEIFLAPELLRFASGYLRSDALSVDTLAWWSFPNKVAVGASGDYYDAKGQNFHFDHGHRRLLKLFIYLTDCDLTTGAHTYLRGTHRRKPFSIQWKHQGLSEAQMANYVPKDGNWLTLEGPAGTAFFEDTYGIHKGLEPQKGSRLLLQVMYSLDALRAPNFSTTVNVNEYISSLQELSAASR